MARFTFVVFERDQLKRFDLSRLVGLFEPKLIKNCPLLFGSNVGEALSEVKHPVTKLKLDV